jgi:hypothetical protein
MAKWGVTAVTIISMSRVDPDTIRCVVEWDGVSHEFSITARVQGDIRSFTLIGATREQSLLIHNSAYSREFARCFWQFYDRKDTCFPVSLNCG